ncbi:uncharacterized protein [Pleurodeles waltl]|uniref:uncharacterized protein n=1 Tax=Pleurodeles waltl TaxID=8319 RepID=UPI0037095A16
MTSPPAWMTTQMHEDSSNANNPGKSTNNSLPSCESGSRPNAVPPVDYSEAANISNLLPTYSQKADRIPRAVINCNNDNVVMTTRPVDLPCTYHEGDKQSHSTCSGENSAANTQSLIPPLTSFQPADNKSPDSTSSSKNGKEVTAQPTNPPPPYPEHAGMSLPHAVHYQKRGAVVTTQPAITTTMNTIRETEERDYLVFSIFNLLFCCLILGFVALFASIQTKTANARGARLEAKAYSSKARRYNISSLVIGIIAHVAWMVYFFVGVLPSLQRTKPTYPGSY